MYQRPKSCDCGVISVGRSGISVSLDMNFCQLPMPNSQFPTPDLQQVPWELEVGSWELSGQHIRDVLLPVYIVALREIRAEVSAATLLASKRRPRNEKADRNQTRQPAELSLRPGFPLRLG